MKNKFTAYLTAAGILLTGCASGMAGMVTGTVGPAGAPVPAVPDKTGTLTVYSAFEVNADFNSRDPYRREYSNYRIYTADGQLVERVQNDNGSNLGSPAAVSLAPGRYRVVAHANGYGMVTVPVVVAGNQVTTVHLEGGNDGSDDTALDQSSAVRLPDGNIVGQQAAR